MPAHAKAQGRFIRRFRARTVECGEEAQPSRILVVDDQAFLRTAIAAELSREGYEVDQAADAAQAIAMVSGGATYELVLTDIDMPGPFNGIQLAEFTKYVSPHTRVIVLSGRPRAGEISASIDLYLMKPTASADLRRKVADMLNG
jgi:CheY-like chemotaxis protein